MIAMIYRWSKFT